LEAALASLAPGDILITLSTDPAWTPLFARLGGLVMETGGQLAHGAVVAREYGLPAVAGVRGATTRIPDGAQILVDGYQGTVTLLEG
jgi:pyruvate,water dikinase